VASTSADVRRATIGGLLALLGLLLCVLYRVVDGTESHAYSSGTLPPPSVRLTAGNSYLISVRGGANAIVKNGGALNAPQCEWSSGGSPAQPLTVTAYEADTKATNAVGSFVAPVTGPVHVACTGWGAVFVDDADNAPGDVAGWLLLAGVVALTLGGGLAVSALATGSHRRASGSAASQQDQVERSVDVAVGGGADDEVVGAHGRHLAG
jgi:hypothetical protein